MFVRKSRDTVRCVLPPAVESLIQRRCPPAAAFVVSDVLLPIAGVVELGPEILVGKKGLSNVHAKRGWPGWTSNVVSHR